MKVEKVAVILNSMTRFEFWCFMKSPIKERWRILRRKNDKSSYRRNGRTGF